jgi:hypothetical protein
MTERPAKSYDEMRPGRFLKAGLFGGKPVTLTIQAVNLDDLDGEKGRVTEGIVRFNETDKGWVLNSTNKQCMKALFGEAPDAAVGHKVTLYAARTNLSGEDVEAIRVWGTPELERDRVIEIHLPKRKPIKMTMHAVKGKAAPQTATATREPGSDDA